VSAVKSERGSTCSEGAGDELFYGDQLLHELRHITALWLEQEGALRDKRCEAETICGSDITSFFPTDREAALSSEGIPAPTMPMSAGRHGP